MLTINGRYQFSKELLLHSTIIQDMMSHCEGELPSNIELPNVVREISPLAIKELEKVKNWEPLNYNDLKEDSGRHIKKETLDLAVLLDMRDLIPVIIFGTDGIDFFEELQIPNILKACIEHCNGQTYTMLRVILKCSSLKVTRTCFILKNFQNMKRLAR